MAYRIFPKLDACADYAGLSLSEHRAEENFETPKNPAMVPSILMHYNKDATGSSNRVSMLYLQTEPQLDAGEVDKGNLNQGNIIKRRAEKIEELYQKQAREFADYSIQL